MFEFLVFGMGYVGIDEKWMKTSHLSFFCRVYCFGNFDASISNRDVDDVDRAARLFHGAS